MANTLLWFGVNQPNWYLLYYLNITCTYWNTTFNQDQQCLAFHPTSDFFMTISKPINNTLTSGRTKTNLTLEHSMDSYLSNTLTNLCIVLYCILLYCVIVNCIVLLIYCYVDLKQYNATHKFVGVLDNPQCINWNWEQLTPRPYKSLTCILYSWSQQTKQQTTLCITWNRTNTNLTVWLMIDG